MGEDLRGYYIHYNARDTIGASKKIDMQLEAFAAHYDIEEINIRLKSKSYVRNAVALLPFGSLTWDFGSALDKIKDPDFLYIRKNLYDRRQYLFLKEIKHRYPKCRIIPEIFTWPYIKRSLFTITGILAVKDVIYAARLKKYIDRYVTYSDDDELLGVKTIRTINGINVDSVKRITHKAHPENEIHLISVAAMEEWHGYGRLLDGYLGYRKKHGDGGAVFYLHLVGDGSCREKYENFAKEHGIEQNVLFYGFRDGEELHEVYCDADLGLSTLAWYMYDVNKSSALKVREYLAKGLPIVAACREDAFDGKDRTFCLEFPNDPSPIDFEKIEEFYHRIYDGREKDQVAEDVRTFAKSSVDMDTTMKPVYDQIEDKRTV